MSETSTEARPDSQEQPVQGDTQGDKGRSFTPITSQEDLDRALGERLARERAKFADYGELKAKASKFDQIEERNKTELQKLSERAERAEAERDAERLNLARQQAAMKAGLPAEMAARLTGTTAEELAADASELAKLVAPQSRTPMPTPAQSGGQPAASGDWLGEAFRRKS